MPPTVEQRLAKAEALAEERGVDISVHLDAIARRIEAMEKRLHPLAHVKHPDE